MTDFSKTLEKQQIHFLLFTGHRIDVPGRKTPRFPAKIEDAVTEAIYKVIKKIKTETSPEIELIGIAGGASGGDIIFHEQCKKLGIPTQLMLALPPKEYKKKSVADSGEEWVTRFDRLYKTLSVFTLTKDFRPKNKNEELNIWQKNNLWQLEYCQQNGSENLSLLALWDGKKGDGPGGTEDMINQVKKAGGEVTVIDINKFL